MKLTLDAAKASPDYVFYWFRSSIGQHQLLLNMSANGVPAIAQPIPHLRSIRLSLPLPPVQRTIGSILSYLDRRIALCREQASTLESIAAAIFKSRFVDFDGITEFEDSEIGLVPQAWSIASLVDIGTFVNGGAFTKRETGSGKAILRIADLNSGMGRTTKYGDFDVPREQAAHAGDILFAWSGSLGLWLWNGTEAIVNQHIFNCFPRDGLPHWFLHQTLLRKLPAFQAIAADKATTMGHIKRSHLAESMVAVPPSEAIDEIGTLMGSLYQRNLSLNMQKDTLVNIRDALLPKLVSGELEVPASLLEVYGGEAPAAAV